MSVEGIPEELRLSRIQKLTSRAARYEAKPSAVRKGGIEYRALEPNSLGIPSISTCPGSTEICRSICYAVDAAYRDATEKLLQDNWDVLRAAETAEVMAEKLRHAIAEYKVESDKLGIPESKRWFRIHWSGDFDTEVYAVAWRMVIEENPDIQFLAYSRTYQEDINVLPILAGIENLDLFLSVDQQNVERAAEVLPDYPDVRVAYLVLVNYEQALPLAKILGRADKLEGYHIFLCPENEKDERRKHTFPLVNEEGGACSRCRWCFSGPSKRKNPKWDVVFINDHELQVGMTFDKPIPIEIIEKPIQEEVLGQMVLASVDEQLEFINV